MSFRPDEKIPFYQTVSSLSDYPTNDKYEAAITEIQPHTLRKYSCELIYMLAAPVVAVTEYAHPAIALAAQRHQRVVSNPFDRTRRTTAFVMSVLHGTPQQRAAMCDLINKQHSFIKGCGYSAENPELQMWVLACFYWTVVVVRESLLGPMDPDEKWALCREYELLGRVLKIPPGMWPQSMEAFDAYWDNMVESLVVDENAMAVGKIILYTMKWPWYLFWVPPFQRMLVTHWMPEKFRVAYGLPKPNPVILWITLKLTALLYFGSPLLPYLGLSWLLWQMNATSEKVATKGRW